MMVIGGSSGGEYTDEVLKFNMESENDDCYLEPYPFAAGHMVASFLKDGKVKSCGGEGGYRGYDLDDCFDYDPQADAWNRTPRLPEERVGMKSAHVEGPQWLLAGGGSFCGEADPSVNATTDLWDGEKFLPGPTLYGECFDHHCQVGLDPTHVFFADGRTGKTWILDWDTQEYIQQDSMRPKDRPGCGKIVNKDGELEVVVTSDGITEIFSFASRTWRSGPDMPIAANSFAYDQIGDTFVLVGGNAYNNIYQFDPLHYQWILKPYQLDHYLADSAILSIRRDAIQCP